MTDPSVCVLVLNWNGADDTLDCLYSLKKITYKKARIVVIDNGSTDDSVSRIQQSHPDVHILELPTNLLFGGGNNAGLSWCNEQGYDFVAFLNNDTTVEPDFLEPLINTFSDVDKVGMAAPLICYADTPDQVWYGGGSVNLWTGKVVHRHIRDSVQAVQNQAVNTDYITGCCLVMPTQLAVELQGFDPGYKMYGEDLDLSLRCKNLGYQLVFIPESKIYHKVSASVGGEFSLKKMHRKAGALLKVYSRHAKWYQYLPILLSQGWVLGSQIMQVLIKSRRSLK